MYAIVPMVRRHQGSGRWRFGRWYVVGFEQFLEGLRALPVPAGFGLLTVNRNASGTEVIEVTNPRFMYSLPEPLEDHPMKLVLVPEHVLLEAAADLDAVPLERMPGWYRFAVWERDEHRY